MLSKDSTILGTQIAERFEQYNLIIKPKPSTPLQQLFSTANIDHSDVKVVSDVEGYTLDPEHIELITRSDNGFNDLHDVMMEETADLLSEKIANHISYMRNYLYHGVCK
jgi:hypothetical protein